MKSLTLTVVLVISICARISYANPEPEPAKGVRYRAAQIIDDNDEVNIEDNGEGDQSDISIADIKSNNEASSGRLFMRKLLLFRNMFGSNSKQPIIILTGNQASTSNPTSTVTSTGTVPTATGTITTSPVVAPAPPAAQRIQLVGRDSNDTYEQEEEQSVAVDEQALAEALGAGAEEFEVTNQEIKGTSNAKSNNGRVNLKRRGSIDGQLVSVRIPPKYRGYFQNGQRVILNNANRPVKRRVVNRRIINKRNRNINNKRRRINAAQI